MTVTWLFDQVLTQSRPKCSQSLNSSAWNFDSLSARHPGCIVYMWQRPLMCYMPVLGPDIGSKLAVLVLFGLKPLLLGKSVTFPMLVALDIKSLQHADSQRYGWLPTSTFLGVGDGEFGRKFTRATDPTSVFSVPENVSIPKIGTCKCEHGPG